MTSAVWLHINAAVIVSVLRCSVDESQQHKPPTLSLHLTNMAIPPPVAICMMHNTDLGLY